MVFVCNPKGCAKVAGGRSVAETSGKRRMNSRTPEWVPEVLAPFQGAETPSQLDPVVFNHRLLSRSLPGCGGLRPRIVFYQLDRFVRHDDAGFVEGVLDHFAQFFAHGDVDARVV